MPKKGTRDQTPRSPKQRAHADRIRALGFAAPARVLAANAPASSWWVGASRDELHARVVEEQPRIRGSKFGSLMSSGATAE